jgi:hypothetical protein
MKIFILGESMVPELAFVEEIGEISRLTGDVNVQVEDTHDQDVGDQTSEGKFGAFAVMPRYF